MPLDPTGELRRKSQQLGIPEDEAKKTSAFEARIYLTLLDQNRAADKTNAVIFSKLDAAAELARQAVSTAEAAHSETMGIKEQIDTKFKELNGSVGRAVDRLKKLEDKDGDRDAEALRHAIEQNATKVATQGVLMVPKPTWRQITVLGGVIAFIGFDHLVSVFRIAVGLISKL